MFYIKLETQLQNLAKKQSEKKKSSDNAWTIFPLINEDEINVLGIAKWVTDVTTRQRSKSVWPVPAIGRHSYDANPQTRCRNSEHCSMSLQKKKKTRKKKRCSGASDVTPLSWGVSLLFGFFSVFISSCVGRLAHRALLPLWSAEDGARSVGGDQTDHPLTPLPTAAPPPQPEKTGGAARCQYAASHRIFLLVEQKAEAPRRLCVNDGRGERLQRSFALPFRRTWRGRWKMGPVGPCRPPGGPAAAPWIGPLSYAAQSQLAFITGDINPKSFRVNEDALKSEGEALFTARVHSVEELCVVVFFTSCIF